MRVCVHVCIFTVNILMSYIYKFVCFRQKEVETNINKYNTKTQKKNKQKKTKKKKKKKQTKKKKKKKKKNNIKINQVLVNTMIVSLHLRPPTTENYLLTCVFTDTQKKRNTT